VKTPKSPEGDFLRKCKKARKGESTNENKKLKIIINKSLRKFAKPL